MTGKKLIPALLIGAALTLSACGGGGNSSTTVTTATVGQQLTDLKTALDAGAITPEEYERKRKEILRNG